jgi:hypothetical protein
MAEVIKNFSAVLERSNTIGGTGNYQYVAPNENNNYGEFLMSSSQFVTKLFINWGIGVTTGGTAIRQPLQGAGMLQCVLLNASGAVIKNGIIASNLTEFPDTTQTSFFNVNNNFKTEFNVLNEIKGFKIIGAYIPLNGNVGGSDKLLWYIDGYFLIKNK